MNSFDFLPDDYVAPKSSNHYMKLQDGENKIRILSKPIIGWEDWVDKKPVRRKLSDKPEKSFDPKKPFKHFWSMIVWNYTDEEIQILHITQASIRRPIETLCKDNDWGAPFFYDIKIIRKGDGMETEYVVNPLPHKPLKAEVKDKFHERKCNLEAIFHNEDPFSSEWKTYTQGIFSEEDMKKSSEKNDKLHSFPSEICTEAQSNELQDLINENSEEFQNSVKKFLLERNLKMNELPLSIYVNIKNRALKRLNEEENGTTN